jgi:hypothetical protein
MRIKKAWIPLTGIWGVSSEDERLLECLYIPGKRYPKPFELSAEVGADLLEAFRSVENVEQLLGFLNKYGSPDLREDRDLEQLGTLYRDDPIDSARYLKSAHALRRLTELKINLADNKNVATRSRLALSQAPSKRYMRLSEQVVSFSESLEFFDREIIPRFFLPSKQSWKYGTMDDVPSATVRVWANDLLRMALVQLIGDGLRLKIDDEFRAELWPNTPVELMALSLLDEFSSRVFRRKCLGPGCSNYISLSGQNARNKHARFCSDACKQRAYEHRKRLKSLEEAR